MTGHTALVIFGTLSLFGVAVGLWCWVEEALDRANSDAVRDLRRTYVERRLGLERSGSPPPLWPHKERRKGQRPAM